MKKVLALVLACTLLISLGACGNNKTTTTGGDFKFTSYPMETDETLTYWVALSPNAVSVVTDMGDSPFGEQLMRETGVKIDFIHPAAGQGEQSFGLMIASNELTDIIEYGWLTVAGGPSKAISDETIIPLNDYIDEAPNLMNFLNSNPDYERSARTDDGEYYMFPFVRDDYSLLISAGPIIRKDWLDDLGLKVPKTIDDWTKMLTAFKEQKGATAPLSFNTNVAMNFFGALSGFYQDNGVVKYGPAEPEYKVAIEGYNDWFKKGLLDPNYMSNDAKALDSNILSGKSGAAYGSGGSGLGKWLSAADPNSSYDLIGAQYPEVTPGKPNRAVGTATPFQASGAAISTSCKNIPLAMRLLDYGYSEAGHMLYNFGEEGVSYELVDGEPVYTDVIQKNPDGLAVSQAMAKYFKAAGSGPFAQDRRYIEQYYSTPQQKDALAQWMVNLDLSQARALGAIIPTTDETSESATLLTEIEKYVQEMTVRFITGIEPLSNYDAYLKRLDDLKIDRAIELKQNAYDRFIKR